MFRLMCKREDKVKRIKGAIFDLDGTILDSTWVWKRVDEEFLGKYGFEVPEDYSDAIKAMGFEQVAEYTITRFRLPLSTSEVMAEWNQMAARAYSEQVKIRHGTKELLLWLKEQGIPAGVATSNTALLFEPCLKNNGIYDLFHSFTEANEVDRGKEFPDIYIKEAGKLGCEPSSCIVFEDIIPALKGAGNGGFVTIGVKESAWGYEEEEFGRYCDHILYEISDAISLLKQMD